MTEAERISALERSVGRLRKAMLVVVVLLCAVVGVAAAGDKIVRAERFELVTAEGSVRGGFALDFDGSGFIVLMDKSGDPVWSAPPPPAVPTAKAPSRAPAASEAPKWREVGKWAGSGPKRTETFKVASRDWRVRWKSWGEPFAGAGLLQVYVYSDDDELLQLAANHQGVGRDETMVKKAGAFYLDVNAANISWEVVVEVLE